MMIDRADQDITRFLSVEYLMGLEAKSTMSRCQVVSPLSYAREIREEAERAFEPCVIRFGLILAKSPDGELEDIEKLRARSDRKTILSHRGKRLAAGQRQECRSWCRQSACCSRDEQAPAGNAALVHRVGERPMRQAPHPSEWRTA